MHLGKFQLCLCARSLWECGIPNDVAESLTICFILGEDFALMRASVGQIERRGKGERATVPFCVIADYANIDEAA